MKKIRPRLPREAIISIGRGRAIPKKVYNRLENKKDIRKEIENSL